MAASVRGNSVCILHISSGQLGFLLINFWESHHSFSRNIWTPLHSKFETFTHALIVIASYHVLIKNFLKWYEAETYIGDTLWWLNLVYDFINLATWFLLVFYFGMCTLSFYHIHCVQTSTQWLVWRIKFQVWSCKSEYLLKQFIKGILNVSFQLLTCPEICK